MSNSSHLPPRLLNMIVLKKHWLRRRMDNTTIVKNLKTSKTLQLNHQIGRIIETRGWLDKRWKSPQSTHVIVGHVCLVFLLISSVDYSIQFIIIRFYITYLFFLINFLNRCFHSINFKSTNYKTRLIIQTNISNHLFL